MDDALDVGRVVSQAEIIGVTLDHPLDEVDLLGDRSRRIRMVAGNIDRPELSLDAPFAQARNVGLTGIEALRQVELRECEIAVGAQPPWKVVVAVEEHAGGMDLPRRSEIGGSGPSSSVAATAGQFAASAKRAIAQMTKVPACLVRSVKKACILIIASTASSR